MSAKANPLGHALAHDPGRHLIKTDPLPFGRERDSALASTIQPLNKVTPRVWQDAAARGFGSNEHAQWQ